MPTKDQMNAALDRIRGLENSAFRRDGNRLAQTPDGDLSFADLSEGERMELLEGLHWHGFSEEEIREAAANVADGIDPAMPSADEALFREWRDDQSQRPLAEKGVDYSDRPYEEEQHDPTQAEIARENSGLTTRLEVSGDASRQLVDCEAAEGKRQHPASSDRGSEYERALEKSAEMAKYRATEPDRGRDR